MVTNVNYQNPIHQMENCPLVTITETHTDTKISMAVDAKKSSYTINLAFASFGGIEYPVPGSQWLLKKISGVWTLMARAPQQNPQLDPGFTPVVGETYIGGDGTTHVVSDLAVNGAISEGSMVGEIRMWPTVTAPTNWHLCDGTSLLRSTYAGLFNVLCPALGAVTMTINTPCVVTFNSHGLSVGDKVFFTTTGALPTGLSTNTSYWVISTTTNTFEISATQGGSAINTSGSQSGVHTLLRTYFGIADAAHFNAPDYRGRVAVGRDSSQTEFAAIGMTGGEKSHTMTTTELVGHTHTVGTLANAAENAHTHGPGTLSTDNPGDHTHTIGADNDTASGSFGYSVHRGAGSGGFQSNASSTAGGHSHNVTAGASAAGSSHNHAISGATASTGSGTAFNVLDPYMPINYIIRLL